MKTFVYISTYAGIDWHDCRTTHEYLKQNGSYEITDVDSVIIDFIKRERNRLIKYFEKENKVYYFASNKKIEYAVKNKKKLSVIRGDKNSYTDTDGKRFTYYETELDLKVSDKGDLDLVYSAWGGQFTATHYICIDVIDDKNVRYIASENFLCPNKGVPSVQRFYHKPFESFTEFKSYFDNMKLHSIDKTNVWAESEKEMLVIDIEKYEVFDEEKQSPNLWFSDNMEAIELTDKLRSSGIKEIPFKMYVNQHLENLRTLF